MTYHAGFDYFSPDAGEHETVECKACLEDMDVERDVLRTKGKFGQALPEHFIRKVDLFTCRNAGKDWHDQVIRLMQEADRTPSQKITEIYEAEVEQIRRTRCATKRGPK